MANDHDIREAVAKAAACAFVLGMFVGGLLTAGYWSIR